MAWCEDRRRVSNDTLADLVAAAALNSLSAAFGQGYWQS